MLFNLCAEFELEKKPVWLDDFRKKFDKPYQYHITLKSLTHFQPQELENIKQQVKEISKKYSKIKVVFSKLKIEKTPNGWCIMIDSQENTKLKQFQSEIQTTLSEFGESYSKEYAKYETDFHAHITIGRRISDDLIEQAKSEIGETLISETTINSITLTVVQDNDLEQLLDKNNKTNYNLSGE